MNVQVLYCNHHTASLDVREKLAFSSEAQLQRAYADLRLRFPQTETVVISTCNRIEVYTAQEQQGTAPSSQQLAQFFSEFHQLPVDTFFADLLQHSGSDAVQHLFEVACSIDSMVLGENQIVSQVKSAYDVATRSQANGPLTNALFQRALAVSRRVRTETKLSEGRVSIASVAVGEFGRSIFDRFSDKTVLIIGAGEMAEETLRYLQSEGVGRLLVCNRSLPRAQLLAAAFNGDARPWEDLDRWLAEVDIVVSATGATQPIISRERLAAVRAETGERPLLILDLGAPRDIAPDAGTVDDGVFLYDIDDLEATCERNRTLRATEIDRARGIIAEETSRFMHDIYHQATGPIIQRLREEWHAISKQELDLLFRKRPHLRPEDRLAVERSVERIVNKLLHPPLQTIREEAKSGTPHGLLETIRRLFNLDE
ncbi:MAG: glutamyl-tRNA reductase [Planctomycetaceae bacterium]